MEGQAVKLSDRQGQGVVWDVAAQSAFFPAAVVVGEVLKPLCCFSGSTWPHLLRTASLAQLELILTFERAREDCVYIYIYAYKDVYF